MERNKRAILTYTPGPKDLKLIWERDPKTERIIKMFQPVRDLGSGGLHFIVLCGRARMFYVLNVTNHNIREFQERVRALPVSPLELTDC